MWVVEYSPLLHCSSILGGKLGRVAACNASDDGLHIQEGHNLGLHSAYFLRVMERCMLNNLNRKGTELSCTGANPLEVEVMIKY